MNALLPIGFDRDRQHEVVTESLRSQLIGWARDALPDECCGVLLGREATSAGIPEIRIAYPLTNTAAEPRRSFAFDAAELAQVTRLHRGELDVVGFFHSHPSSPPAPSRSDIDHASAWPGYLQIIIGQGGAGFEVCCFLVGEHDWHQLEQRSDSHG
ncbi:MAG: Mov34/MPN/PAD-1 family protein [Pseudomonadota bacterium]